MTEHTQEKYTQNNCNKCGHERCLRWVWSALFENTRVLNYAVAEGLWLGWWLGGGGWTVVVAGRW